MKSIGFLLLLRPTYNVAAKLLLPLIACLVVSGCANTDVVSMKVASETVGKSTDEQELWRRGEEIERRIAYSESVYENEALISFLQSIVDRLVQGYAIPETTRPRVILLKSNAMNAFALPHGALYFTLGLMGSLDHEAEYAIIASHELTHFLNRHALSASRDNANREKWSIVGTVLLAGIGGAIAGEAGGRALGSLSQGSMQTWRLAAVSGYSRELETEADTEGLHMARQAGYDVSVAPQIFSRLRENTPASDEASTYYATHPALAEREAHYRELLAQLPVTEVSGTGSQEDFRSYTDAIVHDLARLNIEDRQYDRSQASLESFLGRHPDDADALFLHAEVKRLQNQPDDDVIAAYELAVNVADANPEAWKELGLVLRSAGRMQESTDALQTFIALRPDAIEVPLFERYVAEFQQINNQEQ